MLPHQMLPEPTYHIDAAHAERLLHLLHQVPHRSCCPKLPPGDGIQVYQASMAVVYVLIHVLIKNNTDEQVGCALWKWIHYRWQ